MEFRKINLDDKTLDIYVSLMTRCFPNSHKFTMAYLRWLYQKCPDGEAIGFDAFEGKTIAAHYAALPVPLTVHGETVRAIWPLNSVTHPDFQRRGLYVKLAKMTFQLAAENGYSCVYAVANANSTPGCIRGQGYQLIQPLEAGIGVGKLQHIPIAHQKNIQFKRNWTPESLQWRLSNPDNPVFWEKKDDHVRCYAKSINGLIPITTEIRTDITPASERKNHLLRFSPAKLFIGLVPKGRVPFKRYFPIPERFKPSPLNFIFRPLDDKTKMIEKGKVLFSFLDFDAY